MLRVVTDADARAEMAAGLDEIVREGARRMLAVPRSPTVLAMNTASSAASLKRALTPVKVPSRVCRAPRRDAKIAP